MRASTQPPSRVVDFARSVFQGGVPEFWHWITKRRKSPPCKTLITFEYKHAAGTPALIRECGTTIRGGRREGEGASLDSFDPVFTQPSRGGSHLTTGKGGRCNPRISFTTAKRSDRRAGRDATSIGGLRSRARETCGRRRKEWFRRDPYFLFLPFLFFPFFFLSATAAAAASKKRGKLLPRE